jgi:subtilisin-like proprotein convertase family protein
MRRVDAEGDSRGVQGRKLAETRSRTRVRAANLEWLEDRALMTTSLSTLPSPTVLTPPNLSTSLSAADAAGALTGSASASAPSVAVDPTNSLKMVAVWTDQSLTGYNAGNFVAPITEYAQGAYSTDGGKTWTQLTGFGKNSANVQEDFSLTVPTNGTVNVFTQTTDASVGYDRNGNFYVLTSTHDAAALDGTSTAGVLDVQRFNFSGTTPVLQSTAPTVVYAWDKPDSGNSADPAVTPVLAVDSNVASYTDPTTSAVQTDKYAGNVYVIWASVDSNTGGGIPSFNPNTIRMAASSNLGNSFTAPAYVDNSSNANNYNSPVVTNPPSSGPLHDASGRYAAPQATISQGSATVPGGQLTIVYDDYGTQAPLDRILSQTNTVGGTSDQFTYSNGLGIGNIGTSIPITVNITDPNFVSLDKLDITTSIVYPGINDIDAYVVPPTALNTLLTQKLGRAYPGYILLFEGDVTAQSGTADAGTNLGVSASGEAIGTTFDTAAVRSIEDSTAAQTAVGYYLPDGDNVLASIQKLNLTAAQLNGVWHFESDMIAANTSTAPKYVDAVDLNFSSGNNPGSGGATPQVTIADMNSLVNVPVPGINSADPASLPADTQNAKALNNVTSTGVSGSGNTIGFYQGNAILPAPVIASDNTLGSFSEFQGRLYVAFTGMYSDAAAGNTDILLFTSDDGGKTWSNGLQVNDDNAATDGFSASGNVDGTIEGRAQFDPQIAVDNSTGDVVLSFFDARNDSSGFRVSTYIAASNDGGATFAPQVYANPTTTATNAITGAAVNLGPVPDDEFSLSAQGYSSGYGSHEALVVTNGRIIPFWASNQSLAPAGSANLNPLQIVDSILSLPAGPRIISSTQGPVGGSSDTLNTTRAADGTPKATTFTITFDNPIDPTAATLNALLADTTVYYKSPNGGTSLSLPVTGVTALNTTAIGATEFQITFNPASVLTTYGTYVGTYSYAIKPTGIDNRIRTQGATNDAAGVFAYAAPVGAAVANATSYATSSVTVSGHTGQYLIANPTGAAQVNAAYPAGNVAGTITTTITTNVNATYLSVYLVTPDGQRVTISAATYNPFGSATLTLNAAKFTIPSTNTVPLDGTYTLEIVDDTGLNTISYTAWHLTLNGVLASAGTTTTGATMDQNANGKSGQIPGDDFVVGEPTGFNSYATGTLPLIVPGVHLSGTAAIDSTGTVISSGTNNLVTNTTVNALQLTFDRNIQISSFTTSQILSIFGPAGSISLAGLTITPLTVYSNGAQVPYAAGGTVADVFKVTFLTQELSGTYTVTLGAGILAADGTAIDPTLNAGLDALRQTATNGNTISVTYPSTAVPAAIPTGTVAAPGMLTAPITVPINFPVQGDNNGIAGLTLTLNITYPVDPNLTAYLLAPDGVTQIALFTKVGTGTNTANFSTTTFSDEGSTLISNAGAPFFGTFKPQEPLANLATQDNLTSIGTWSLVILNTGSQTGTLNSWSLTFQKPVSSTGLGINQSQTSFQIFNLDPSSTLASSTWTAVGPAGVTTSTNGTGTFAGTISTMVVDPSDKTGNTVFIGSASGGIWKTTDFLTTSPAGPTYQPLTDFGPNFSLNIGSIAAFGVNSNPAQTVLFAGTGFGQETTTSTAGYANVELNSGAGVGILKSTDGGQTWTLLDSLNNTLPDSQRDHTFVGTTTYKIIVDPKPELNGDIIVYAALGGPNGGLYRSLDSGETWSLLSGSIGGAATDVLLDPNSASPTTGNLQILYAAFPNHGVYQSSNQGQTLQILNGQLGKDPLIVSSGFPAAPLPVFQSPTPSGLSNDIVLAKPALTDSVSENIDYQGWIYAAVESPFNTFEGLFVSKDDGQNWVEAVIGNDPGSGPVKTAVPTNDSIPPQSYDPTSSNFSQQGAYDLSLTVDPTNPNIVYIGGTGDFQGSGLIRVDLTDIRDSENFTSFSDDRNDGGVPNLLTDGGVTVTNPANGPALYDPAGGGTPESNLIDLRYAPNNGTPGVSPFATNATLVTSNASTAFGFANDGQGVTWTLFDEPLKANAGDTTGSTNIHNIIQYVDPVTGDVRMLIADDEGIFTALVNSDGTLSDGTGSYTEPNYSRNGNLQNEQFFYGAAQPSSAASQAAGALFYASGQTTIAAQSTSTILSTGDLTYDNSAVLSPGQTSPRNTPANSAISTSDRSGVGIATDPAGSGEVKEFDVPILGGNLTDFFRVNQNGQTTGLANNVNAEFPQSGNRVSGTTGTTLQGEAANGQIVSGNFAVNPLNGSQMLIASATNNLYETTNDGIQWLPIGNNGNFDGTSLTALAYGAPDPGAPAGVGNLDNFIYVGTSGAIAGSQGHIYVTQGGGNNWTDISSGLDGSSIVGIYPDPNRGSHAAYAVTLNGVYYSPDTIGLSQAGQTVWTSITNNLTSIQYNPFGDPQFAQSVLAGFNANTGGSSVGTTEYGGFTSIVADYRYLIPAASNTPGGTSNVYYPVLYVSGYGGVFDSIDNGATWSVFPNTTFNNAPVNGGYLPSVDVTSLTLVLGNINPDTGHAVQSTGDPEILLATTYGRGNFAISLAPDVFPSTIALDTTLPPPNGSDSGAVRGYPGYTNVLDPVIDGVSEVTNYGNTVTINIYDQANGDLIGTGTTNAFGQFTTQILAQGTNPTGAYYDPSFLVDGLKTIGIQATDSAGAKGNVAIFTYNLKATPPANPTNFILTNDSGRSSTDTITNQIPPTFSVSTTEPASTEVELVRLAYGSTTNYEVVNTQAANGSTVDLTDTLLASELNGATIAQTLTYYVIQIDEANNYSTPLASITTDPTKLSIYLDNQLPVAPQAPTLDPSTNSGTNKGANITNSLAPLFDVATTGLITTGKVAPFNLELFRSANGAPAILVGTAAPGVTQIRDTSGTLSNGVYVYTVAQVDLAGNVSPLSLGTTVTINTTAPAIPTLVLDPADDSGAPTNPNVTNVNDPRFIGTGTAGLPILLLNQATGQGLATTTVSANGTYLVQIIGPVADGTYTLVAQITNSAGNSSVSAPLTITIKHQGPVLVPTLSLQPASDTGIKGDGVTANHHPVFIGTTDPGDKVTLYALTNGVLSAPQATTTASTTNGSFSFQLPFNLNDGTAQLVAQSTDVAGNTGPLSSALSVRIITVAGDYQGTGAAQLTVFNPSNETYAIQGVGLFTVDSTPGRDVPIQYDFNGDGLTDPAAYRFNVAQYYGSLLGSGGAVTTFFGTPGLSLPVSGYYLGGKGSYLTAAFNPNTATWAIAVPQPGGELVQFGAAKIDIPVPAAYDGGGVTEITTFRPTVVAGGDADSFNVDSATGFYQVSFTSAAVQKLGFVYKAGDIPAPADYDGVGHDEFALYRPSTGQFFILNTPNVRNSATWTLRVVTLNLPGGPNVNDVPVPEDYLGNGKADPAVYRPSNSTFYLINSATGVQTTVPFGTPGGSVAAAGPLLYRLTALTGSYASTDGYNTPTTGGGGAGGAGGTTSAFSLHTESVASANTSTGSSGSSSSASTSSAFSTMIAVATPIPITTAVPTPTTITTVGSPASGTTSVNSSVVIGASTPKLFVPTVTEKAKTGHTAKVEKVAADKAKATAKPLTVETKSHAVKVNTATETTKPKAASTATKSTTAGTKSSLAAAAIALQKLVLARKGNKKA